MGYVQITKYFVHIWVDMCTTCARPLLCAQEIEKIAHMMMDMRMAYPYHPDMSKKHQSLPISDAAMPFQPDKPYNALPSLPPPQDIETKEVLKKCVAARSALSALQQATALIPDQDVLISSVPLLGLREAKDSSEIENIVTTNDKLFQFATTNPEHADPATKETLRYRKALLKGFESLTERPLTTRTAVEVCRAIKDVDLDLRRTTGTHLRNHVNGKIIYTPPEGEPVLRELMANWEAFLHDGSDIDPLVRMAIAHYQFEAIHPFPDGNGRTGRILNILVLVQEKLLDLPVLYLSRYINDRRSDYYRFLLGVTVEQDWNAWVLFMLDAVEVTAQWTREKILAVRSLMEQTVRHVREAAPKTYRRELVETIFKKPYCRIGDLVEAGVGNRTTASKYLKDLVAVGVLEEKKSGRDRIYLHVRFFDLLMNDSNAFAPFPEMAAAR
jgi:Fic family protein